jgi:prepilin-type N-terminal cleavage/methylation domain-containing protein
MNLSHPAFRARFTALPQLRFMSWPGACGTTSQAQTENFKSAITRRPDGVLRRIGKAPEFARLNVVVSSPAPIATYISQHSKANRGFTMVELVVVLGIILALAGLGFPVMRSVLEASKRDATKAMVTAVATMIADKGPTGEFHANGILIRLPLWDINHDGILDGTLISNGSVGDVYDANSINSVVSPSPSLSLTQVQQGLATLGYDGFLRTTGFTVKPKQIEATTGRLLDPWKHPLRYAFAPARKNGSGTRTVDNGYIALLPGGVIKTMANADCGLYGTRGFGVWSAGPDGIDNTADDILSYTKP